MEGTDSGGSILDRLRSQYLVKITLLGIAVVVVIGVVGFNAAVSANERITEETQSDLSRSSDIQSEGIGQWRGNLERQTALISDSDAITARESTNVTRYLQTIQSEEGNGLGEEVAAVHLVRLPVFGATGSATVLNSSATRLEGQEVEGVPWQNATFGGASGHRVNVTDPYDSPAVDEQAIAVVSPVGDTSNLAVVVVVNTKRAAELRLEPPSEDGATFVTDADGTVVLSTDQGLVGRPVSELGSGTGALAGGYTGEARYLSGVALDGTPQATGVAGVPEADWTVAAAQPRGSAFALSDSIQETIVVLLGVVVAGFSLFFVVIGWGALADVRELSRKAARVAESPGDAEVTLETDRTDEIGRLVESVDQMQRSLNEQITERIEELEELNAGMTEAVEAQSGVMEDCAEGDLSRRMDTDTGVEQLDEFAATFNAMMDDLEASIGDALTFSNTVAAASEEAAAAASESRQASRDVSENTQEISHRTDRQSEELATVAEEMSSFSASIEEVASSSNQLSIRSNDAAETAREGREAAQTAIDQLRTIQAETESVVDSFETLREEVQTTEEIVEFIGQVTEQTNMLALNANIEASRSGGGDDEGEGFGVVAEEIKELATETQDAASDVEQRLDAISEHTEATAENIDDARTTIQQGTETIQEALEALDEVGRAVEDVDVSVQEIDDIVEKQSDTAQQVVTRIEEVADIAERNAAQAEDVAAAAEEQNATIDEISSTVDELSDQADRLAQHLDQFTVDATERMEWISVD